MSCSKQELKLSNDEIAQIEKNVRNQSSRGTKFFKHRTGRVLGASQSKQASHIDPVLPSQSQIQSICDQANNIYIILVIIPGVPSGAVFWSPMSQKSCRFETGLIAFPRVHITTHITFNFLNSYRRAISCFRSCYVFIPFSLSSPSQPHVFLQAERSCTS